MTPQEREEHKALLTKMADVVKMSEIIESLADDVKEIRTALMGSKLTGDPGYGEKINQLRKELSDFKLDYDLNKRYVHDEFNKAKYIRVGMSLSVGLISGILGAIISAVAIFKLFGS